LAFVSYARRVQSTSRDALQTLDSDSDEQSNLALMLLGAALQVPKHAQIRNSPAVMKATEDYRPASVGSIFEFDDGKHAQPLLGVVLEIETKMKDKKTVGESKCAYKVADKANKQYRVAPKQVHCSFPPNSKLKTSATPEEKLKDYIEIASLKSTDLGVDPEVMELAWEILADEHDVSIEDIMNQIDPDICETPTGRYRAYRLLNSGIGKIFFKRLHSHDYHHLEFQPRTPEKVEASKEKWCNAAADDDAIGKEEFCLM
jgi:hypothetical protein